MDIKYKYYIISQQILKNYLSIFMDNIYLYVKFLI